MAQRYKGERTSVHARVPDEVFEALLAGQKAAGVKSFSQYVADVLALSTGHASLVRELSPNQGALMTA